MLKSIKLFGYNLNPWTMEQTIFEIDRRIKIGQFTQHVCLNVAKIVNMNSDDDLKIAVQECDITNADGMGLVWAGRFLGYDIPERVTGIDLFIKLLEHASKNSISVYLLGATNEVVNKAVENLKKEYPALSIAGWHHGYFWDDEAAIVEDIRQSSATMLFVAISSPKKEQFIHRWQDKLGVKFAMGVGGSFDIVAGITKRAPLWIQKTGLEWMFRIYQEPRRMWKRYLVTNSKFLLMVLQEKLHISQSNLKN